MVWLSELRVNLQCQASNRKSTCLSVRSFRETSFCETATVILVRDSRIHRERLTKAETLSLSDWSSAWMTFQSRTCPVSRLQDKESRTESAAPRKYALGAVTNHSASFLLYNGECLSACASVQRQRRSFVSLPEEFRSLDEDSRGLRCTLPVPSTSKDVQSRLMNMIVGVVAFEDTRQSRRGSSSSLFLDGAYGRYATACLDLRSVPVPDRALCRRNAE